MPISDALAGREFAPTAPFVVTSTAVTDFAAALGDDNPAYRGDDAIAPPTFVAMLAAQTWEPLFAPGVFGLKLSHTIHADQAFEFVRPLRVGDEIRARLCVENVRERGPAAWLSLRVDVETTAGEPVCVCRATLVHTDTRARTDERSAQARSDEPAAGGALSMDVPLNRDMLRRYAAVCGDDNPIHQSDAAAQAVGLPGVIAHGMLTLGLALRVVTDACGDPGRVIGWRARFTHPLPVPPDGTVLRVTGHVADTHDGVAEIAVEAACQADGDAAPTPVLGAAVARVRVPEAVAS